MSKYKIDIDLKLNKGEGSKSVLSLESIVSKLFYFHNQAHFNHLQTKSFAVHKALDTVYNELVDFKDTVSELLLGYIALKRFNIFQVEQLSNISDKELCDKIISFSRELSEYAESNNYIELENVSAEIEGLAVKTKYLLTLN